MAFSRVAHLPASSLRGSAAACLPDRAVQHRNKPCSVAVVGAGAAGLAAAKELQEEGHMVDVFEKSRSVGGVWVLDDRVESDPLGQSGTRSTVHSSLYDSLRVNLPREAMSFSDFPFLPEFMKGRSQDARRFPNHVEVRRYLEAYAEHFDLLSVVSLNTEVVSVVPVPLPDNTSTTTASPVEGSRSSSSNDSLSRIDRPVVWKVTTAEETGGGGPDSIVHSTETYDAVMICNGHYSVPRLPPVEGIDHFPGRCEHSHNYRRPAPYEGLKVLLVGAHASGEDIAWEVASCAREVVLSAKTWMHEEYGKQVLPFGPRGNMFRRGWIQQLCPDGSVILEDGSMVEDVDVVMFCTGYHYSVPFLQQGIVDTSRSHIRTLYQHLLTLEYGPALSFIGLNFKITPFPQFELQCKYIARMLSGRVQVPPSEEMESWMHAHYNFVQEVGLADRHVHRQGGDQWEYNDWLAEQCGSDVEKSQPWRIALWSIARRIKLEHASNEYRDVWDDPAAAETARAALAHRFAQNVAEQKRGCAKSNAVALSQL